MLPLWARGPGPLRSIPNYAAASLTCLGQPNVGLESSRIRRLKQVRFASILGDLHDFNVSYGRRIRRGRGPSSGKGKTSGRGHKGQGQHGGVPAGFNGGQTPLEVVKGLPKGFVNQHAKIMSPLTLNRLQLWIDAGRIDSKKPITFKELVESRCLHGIKDGVKLLVKSLHCKDVEFKTPINITVSKASRKAIEIVEQIGGKVTTRFYNKQGILQTVYPHYFPDNPRLADPTSRKDLEYYRNPENRGYLSHLVQPGENPASLFFKDPKTAETKRRRKTAKKKTDRLF